MHTFSFLYLNTAISTSVPGDLIITNGLFYQSNWTSAGDSALHSSAALPHYRWLWEMLPSDNGTARTEWHWTSPPPPENKTGENRKLRDSHSETLKFIQLQPTLCQLQKQPAFPSPGLTLTHTYRQHRRYICTSSAAAPPTKTHSAGALALLPAAKLSHRHTENQNSQPVYLQQFPHMHTPSIPTHSSDYSVSVNSPMNSMSLQYDAKQYTFPLLW